MSELYDAAMQGVLFAVAALVLAALLGIVLLIKRFC
jgi:hypothetical protein